MTLVRIDFARQLERDIADLNDRLIDRQKTLMEQAIEIQSLKTQLAALQRSASATLHLFLTNRL
jgi:hypothetical protein